MYKVGDKVSFFVGARNPDCDSKREYKGVIESISGETADIKYPIEVYSLVPLCELKKQESENV